MAADAGPDVVAVGLGAEVAVGRDAAFVGRGVVVDAGPGAVAADAGPGAAAVAGLDVKYKGARLALAPLYVNRPDFRNNNSFAFHNNPLKPFRPMQHII